MSPTLHLTNWSSRRLAGPGRRLTIMAAPRAWEHGDGRVPALLPGLANLRALQAGTITGDEYRARFVARLADDAAHLAPETLYTTADGGTAVRDGDTLLCACSREAAARGNCHRVWAAEALVTAGWAVVLDGVAL